MELPVQNVTAFNDWKSRRVWTSWQTMSSFVTTYWRSLCPPVFSKAFLKRSEKCWNDRLKPLPVSRHYWLVLISCFVSFWECKVSILSLSKLKDFVMDVADAFQSCTNKSCQIEIGRRMKSKVGLISSTLQPCLTLIVITRISSSSDFKGGLF